MSGQVMSVSWGMCGGCACATPGLTTVTHPRPTTAATCLILADTNIPNLPCQHGCLDKGLSAWRDRLTSPVTPEGRRKPSPQTLVGPAGGSSRAQPVLRQRRGLLDVVAIRFDSDGIVAVHFRFLPTN